MESYKLIPLGDQAMTLSLGTGLDPGGNRRLIAIVRWLERNPFPGLKDIVVAYDSLTLFYDVGELYPLIRPKTCIQYLREVLERSFGETSNLPIESSPKDQDRLVEVPVCYDDEFAPDMVSVCQHAGLTRDEVVNLHIEPTYTVFMVGFLPGFPYMARLDERLAVPRKTVPAPKVAPGSVGLAGLQTGIYPMASPGGWRIIGRTPLRLFDPTRRTPVLMQPGDRVHFHAVSRTEFNQLSEQA